MNKQKIQKPFKARFLSDFVLTVDLLPFEDDEIVELDKELSRYEQLFMDPEVEKHLISKNELLASFAISKAERSSLTLQEARDVYDLVLKHNQYDFIAKKIKAKQKLNFKDHDKLEFFNIAKTFRKINERVFNIDKLTPQLIKELHFQLTIGLDMFEKELSDFTAYKSGQWRDNDLIRVGSYKPASHQEIPSGAKELIAWLKSNYSVSGVAVFHAALYALHPFNNGNKRVCRILEHILLRGLNLNAKNLFSTSYYYHKQKERYYKYLLYSLERKNLNHFTSFILEAVVLSIISVLKTSLEAKRSQLLDQKSTNDKTKMILKPLIKRKELQFKHLFKRAKKQMARQTFVSYLQEAAVNKLVNKRQAGRAVYYQLNLKAPEAKVLERWLRLAKERLAYIPDDIALS